MTMAMMVFGQLMVQTEGESEQYEYCIRVLRKTKGVGYGHFRSSAGHTIVRSYQALAALHMACRRAMGGCVTQRAFPALPPPDIDGALEDSLIKQRWVSVQNYLQQLARIPGIEALENFVAFVSPDDRSYPKMLRWNEEDGESATSND
jgi:hypothetical protein